MERKVFLTELKKPAQQTAGGHSKAVRKLRQRLPQAGLTRILPPCCQVGSPPLLSRGWYGPPRGRLASRRMLPSTPSLYTPPRVVSSPFQVNLCHKVALGTRLAVSVCCHPAGKANRRKQARRKGLSREVLRSVRCRLDSRRVSIGAVIPRAPDAWQPRSGANPGTGGGILVSQ